MSTTRLPPISDAEYRAMVEKLIKAGQILASTSYRLPNKSVRELVESIQGGRHEP